MSRPHSTSSFFSREFSNSEAFRCLTSTASYLLEVLGPGIDRGLADLVLIRGLSHRGPVCLAQHSHHLLFSESTLSQRFLADW
jgi:hypothetical protein